MNQRQEDSAANKCFKIVREGNDLLEAREGDVGDA
jgi:hypothetical protein